MVFNLKWMLIFSASLAVLAVCALLGLLHRLWMVDNTCISFAIIGLYLAVSPFIGWLTAGRGDAARYTKACAYAAELMMGLGMLGTVIGFLQLLGALNGVDAGNVQAMQKLLAHIGSGMGVALTTTLVGLVCAMLVQVQVVNLEASRV